MRRTEVQSRGNNRFFLELNEASSAFRGFFIEVAFKGPDNIGHLEVTSEIQIIPTAEPFPDCSGYDCQLLGMV